jgi:SAM-dependent methyltransferase
VDLPSTSFVKRLKPFYLRTAVRERLKDCLLRFVKRSDLVCDIGCGARPFSALLSRIAGSQVGIDTIDGFYTSNAIDIAATAGAVPLRDGVADAALASQVIEHLPDPDLTFCELARILKPGGLLFISFPFLYPLHAAPFDFYRYTSHGFEALCRRHGLEVLEEHRLGGFWYLCSVISDVYFSSFDASIFREVPVLGILSLPLMWLFWILHGVEGLAYRLAGRNPSNQRKGWTVNYVCVARRSGELPG